VNRMESIQSFKKYKLFLVEVTVRNILSILFFSEYITIVLYVVGARRYRSDLTTEKPSMIHDTRIAYEPQYHFFHCR